MLVRQVDRKIGLSDAVAAALSDPRDPERITHPLRDLVVQRMYGLCCGYEDLNDNDVLRHDRRFTNGFSKSSDRRPILLSEMAQVPHIVQKKPTSKCYSSFRRLELTFPIPRCI